MFLNFNLLLKKNKGVGKMEEFKKFETYEETREYDGLVLKITLKKNLQGKYDLRIEVIRADDGLTENIFCSDEQGNCEVRGIEYRNNNYYYKDSEDKTTFLKQEFDSHEVAEQAIEEILKGIKEYREKVRQKVKQEYYVVI
jgi:translation elongation factor P/translation initiation factor 5A